MNISKLKKLVNSVEPFLMTADYIPILQHIWFHPRHVTGFNDVQAIQLAFESELHCAVPGKILSKLLGTITQEELDVVQTADKLLIGSGKNQTKLPIMSPDDFVFVFPDPKGVEVELGPEIVEGVEKCLATVSHDPTRPERNGITVKVENDRLTMFTTDGKTISRFTAEGKFRVASTDELWVILPTFFCDQLCRLIKDQKVKTSLYIDAGTVIAKIGENKIFSRLINAKPPQYENAIAKTVSKLEDVELVEIPDELPSVLDRALLMVYPEKGITFSKLILNKEGQLTVLTESDKGRANDVVDLSIQGMELEMSVEPALLQRATGICSLMTVCESVWVCSTENRDFYHLISHKAS
jgi:DNA polymerase III sliding clamp (beta) subunit (PCNA family)